MNYDEMTTEELIALLDSQERELSNLTAERDSYREENDTLRERLTANTTELEAVKKMNYTLARKLDTAPETTAEQEIIALFGR